MSRILCLYIAWSLLIPAGMAGNWPQWRGPDRNGAAEEVNLPSRWTATENIAWRLPLPAFSGSTPIIWNNHVFLNVAEETELYLWCVNRSQSTVLWKKLLGSGNVKVRKQNMSSPSPVTDGKNVWVLTGTGILKAFDFSGNELWMRDIQKEYGRFELNWGYGSSPLLHNDALYIQVLHGMKTDAPSYLLAIEKLTGETLWRIERPTDAVSESHDAYTTPALLRYNGKEDDRGILWCRDAKTGAEIWGSQRVRSGTYSASPVIADGKLFVISEDGVTTVLEAGPEFKVLAENDLAEYTLSSPAISDGQIFLRTQAALYCIGRRTTTSK